MELPLPYPCPECGTARSLTLRTVLLARRPGTFSLAGVQAKTTAADAAEVTCSACGASRRGRLEGAGVSPDGRAFTAGHFVDEES